MKKNWEWFQEFRKKPGGKAILFFGFYFLFFLLIYFYAHTSARTYRTVEEYERGTPYHFSIDDLLKNNYHFSYIISVDGNKYIYVGEREDNRISFTYNNQEYYGIDGVYYLKKEEWEEVDSPILYEPLLSVSNVFSLLDYATYDSKTSYESGKTNYNFLISTNTINQVINQLDSDFMEEPNMIVLSSGSDNKVNQILWNLDSYCVLNSLCEKSMKIELKYSSFGEIQLEQPF